jgi:hypothetical protein
MLTRKPGILTDTPIQYRRERVCLTVMVVYVVCTCGNRWRSTAASGVTGCAKCQARVYIPAKARRFAEAEPGELVFDVGSGRLTRGFPNG